MKKIAILLSFISFISFAYGQMKYADRRIKADIDPRTIDARIEFDHSVRKSFSQASRAYRLEYISLNMNPRMVSQYGRGKDSALEVIPKEIDHVLGLISEARYRPFELAHCLKDMDELGHLSYDVILEAVRKLAQVRHIYMDYWGYMSQTERPPEYDLKRSKLTYRAHWHEADSYYELYAPDQARVNILRSVLEAEEKEWYEFW